MNRVCQVCGDQAKKDKIFHSHYGGTCCKSCKAFFRRSVREDQEYYCKRNGGCIVNIENRIKCKSCRYDKCLYIGMNPSQVLIDEQDRARFTKRKKVENASALPVSPPPAAESGGQLLMTPEQDTAVDIDRIQPGGGDCQLAMSLAESIAQNHILSWANVEMDLSVVDAATDFHKNRESSRMNGQCFSKLLQSYKDHFIAFAQRNPRLSELSAIDQGILVGKNKNIIPHYYMSGYLTASNGVDQLSWLLGPYMPQLELDEVAGLRTVNARQLHNSTGILQNMAWYEIDLYLSYCKYVRKHSQYSQFHNGLMLHLLLFNTRSLSDLEITKLENPKSFRQLYCEARCLFKRGNEHMDEDSNTVDIILDQMMLVLDNLRRLTSNPRCLSKQLATTSRTMSVMEGQQQSCELELTMFLQDKLTAVDHIIYSISPGTAYLDCALQIKRGNMSNLQVAGQIRQQVMSARFQGLLDQYVNAGQREIYARNLPTVMLLFAARQFATDTLEKQLKYIMGFEGSHGNEDLSPIVNEAGNNEPLLSYKMLPMPPRDRMRFQHLMRMVSSLVNVRELFWLLVLIILLDPQDSKETEELSTIRKTYHSIFLKLARPVIQDDDETELVESSDLVGSIMASLREVFTILGRNNLMCHLKTQNQKRVQ